MLQIRDKEQGTRGAKQERHHHQPNVRQRAENETYSPGRRANIFGSVRPIQNGRWNCVQLNSTNSTPVPLPNRLATARRTVASPDEEPSDREVSVIL